MTKAIFSMRGDSGYDDVPGERYHFPQTYERMVREAIGDWIIYYGTRRSVYRSAYFAVARVDSVEPDPKRSGHFYARISDFLQFLRRVPFREGHHYYEKALRRPDGKTSKGALGRAVRAISDEECDAILAAGLHEPLVTAAAEPWRPADMVAERPITTLLMQRPFRDAAFSRQIRQAYRNTCAVTGLQLINGGGRPEVQAAHIRPVADRGPDSMANGIALSGTVHWMFDRGLISIAEDYSVLAVEKRIPDQLQTLIAPGQRLHLPQNRSCHPHPQFLRYHRENVFLG